MKNHIKEEIYFFNMQRGGIKSMKEKKSHKQVLNVVFSGSEAYFCFKRIFILGTVWANMMISGFPFRPFRKASIT